MNSVVSTDASLPPPANHRTIIATFKRPEAAATSFERLKPRLAPAESLRLFGQTLLLSIDASDAAEKHWSQHLQLANAVIVDKSDQHAELTLTCTAANEAAAKAIEEEATEFFHLASSMYLIPPWASSDLRSADERSWHRFERQTYVKIRSAGGSAFSDPVIHENWEKIREARSRDDDARAAQLLADNSARWKAARLRELEQLRQQTDGSVDADLVATYIELAAASDAKALHTIDEQLAPRMGQLALADGELTPDSARSFVTHASLPSRRGPVLRFESLEFGDAFDGPMALARWLASKTCTSFHYQFDRSDDLDSTKPRPHSVQNPRT